VETMLATRPRPGEVAGLQLTDVDSSVFDRVRARRSMARDNGVRAVALGIALTTLYEYVYFTSREEPSNGCS